MAALASGARSKQALAWRAKWPVRVAAGCLLLVATVSFWWAAGRLSSATWQLTVIPSALLGASIGAFASGTRDLRQNVAANGATHDGTELAVRRPGRWVAAGLAAAGFLVADYWVFQARLRRLLSQPQVDNSSAERRFIEQLGKIQANQGRKSPMPTGGQPQENEGETDKKGPLNRTEATPPMAVSDPARLARTAELTIVYVDRIWTAWWQIGVGIGFSAFAAFQTFSFSQRRN